MGAADEGDLRFAEELGHGAVATVYRIEDRASRRSYAGKELHAEHGRDARARERLAREARLVSDLSHPNLVQVHGMRVVEGRELLLMEYVEGSDLARLIAREAPLPEGRCIEIALGISAGLGHAHSCGIVHRDLKPANVLLSSDGVPKVGDFGTARATSLAGTNVDGFKVLGTPDYMAPECMDPLAVDTRTDLYALGCIMFEMLTGRPPFGAPTAFGVVEQHIRAEVPPLPEELSPGLDGLVRSLLAKSPADRPQAAATVIGVLEGATSRGLAVVGSTELVGGQSDGLCAHCGAELVSAVPVCMSCGVPQIQIKPGRHSVVVLGPGKNAERLAAPICDRLREWIRGNPQLGLDATLLEKKYPRVPFALVTDIDEASAKAFAVASKRIGLQTAVVDGSPRQVPALRKKSRALVSRVALVVVPAMLYFSLYGGIVSFMLSPLLAVTLLLSGFVVIPWALLRAERAASQPLLVAAKRSDGRAQTALAEPIERLCRAVAQIEAKRHRVGLHATVKRIVGLSAHAQDAPELADELSRALDLATGASLRVDLLDRDLEERNLAQPDAETRELLHERDTWSGRLLDLTAMLDGLYARFSAATNRLERADHARALQDLRIRVEALEEVENL